MAQNDFIELPLVRYTRADFTALRAYLNRLPLERILALYYTDDDLERLGIATPADLRERLGDMRDHLVQRAADSQPHLAESLRDARRSGVFSKSAIDYLVRAADEKSAAPRMADALSMWFRPGVAEVLKLEGARTVSDLIALINRRGQRWWSPVPRLGARKAARVVNWLERYPELAAQLVPSAPVTAAPGSIVVLGAHSALVPLERIGLPQALSGEFGENRNTRYAQTQARNDLEAIGFYLIKFAGQTCAERAYKKELERFLLWCIKKRGKAMSDVRTEDCEAYKAFLGAPDDAWIGPKAPRHSYRWRPFAGVPSPASQKYAVIIIKAFFDWMTSVGYLRGNPWLTVKAPKPQKKELPIEVGRALPQALWAKLAAPGGILDQLCGTPDEMLRQRYRLRGWTARFPISAQYRLARALLLLLGYTGLRREESARASRDRLRPLDGGELWELAVLGKGSKWRTVFPPQRVIEALRAHWIDRGLDFDFGMQQLPLVAPIATPASRRGKEAAGFSPDGLGRLISSTLKRIADDAEIRLEEDERKKLVETSTHALRHTFGTLFVANEVPLDVVQKVMGHESLDTTTLYVQAEKQRAIAEIGKYLRTQAPQQ